MKDRNENKHLLAVYGILKRGESGGRLMDGAKFIGECYIPFARLYEAPTAPWLVLDNEKGYDVKAELYKVSDNIMDILDRVEGHPYLYERKKLSVMLLEDEGIVWGIDDVFVYVFPHTPAGGVENTSGNFTRQEK